ncbi:MAG: M1 family metallopeptidase [Gemmatimonadota bacterium]
MPVSSQENPGEGEAPGTGGSVPALFRALSALEDSSLSTAAITGFELRRDAGVFHLKAGSLALLELDGRVVGALFDGNGTFTISPRRPVERAQLARLYGAEAPTLELSRMLLLFNDATDKELDGLDFTPAPPSGNLKKALREGLEYLGADDFKSFDADLAMGLLNSDAARFFHTAFDVPGRGPHYFRVADGDTEEVSFGREAGGRGKRYETVSRFDLESEPVEGDPAETLMPPVSVIQIQLTAEFDSKMRFEGAGTAYMTTSVPGGAWVPFNLHRDLEIDSLAWGDGREVEFTRGKGSSQVWIRIPEDVGNGSFLQLSSAYHGRVGEWRGMWYFFHTTTGWYLSTPGTSASFDITLRSPENLPVVSIGRRVDRSVGDGVVTTRWVNRQPFNYASFNIGRFKEWEFDHQVIPPLRVQMNQRAHSGLPLKLQRRNAQNFVADDITTSYSFFQNNIGPLDQEEVNATEIPYLHGQAFPGMVHLSFVTFGLSDEEGINELFRAHEVAHQWWGITMRPRSYRDQWLGEGMAEFSALWYLEAKNPDSDAPLETLRKYRDHIRGRAGKTGPTGLGSRVGVGGDREDHQIMVYEKGAWIGHMIRHMLIDYDTGDERVLRAFLRELTERYHNRRISTREFQAVLERYVQGDMSWFFKQWVDGTNVPDYIVDRSGEALPNGQYSLRLVIRQENVPGDFRMVVPVLLNFGAQRVKIVRIMVAGPETVQEFTLPAEPLGVQVNPFEAVLARVRQNW